MTAHFAALGDVGREYVAAEIAGWDTSPPHDLADEMADGTEPAAFWEVARSARAAKGAGDYGTAAAIWLLARDLLPDGHPLRGGLDRLIAALREGEARGGFVTRDGRLLPVEAAVIPAASGDADADAAEPGRPPGCPAGAPPSCRTSPSPGHRSRAGPGWPAPSLRPCASRAPGAAVPGGRHDPPPPGPIRHAHHEQETEVDFSAP